MNDEMPYHDEMPYQQRNSGKPVKRPRRDAEFGNYGTSKIEAARRQVIQTRAFDSQALQLQKEQLAQQQRTQDLIAYQTNLSFSESISQRVLSHNQMMYNF